MSKNILLRTEIYLQEETNASPRECSMNWIILHCAISNLFEDVQSPDHLVKKISNNHSLTGLPGVSPTSFDTVLLCGTGQFVKFFNNLAPIQTAKIDVALVIFAQLCFGKSPKIGSGPTKISLCLRAQPKHTGAVRGRKKQGH